MSGLGIRCNIGKAAVPPYVSRETRAQGAEPLFFTIDFLVGFSQVRYKPRG
jgi:hypothetical protein